MQMLMTPIAPGTTTPCPLPRPRPPPRRHPLHPLHRTRLLPSAALTPPHPPPPPQTPPPPPPPTPPPPPPPPPACPRRPSASRLRPGLQSRLTDHRLPLLLRHQSSAIPGLLKRSGRPRQRPARAPRSLRAPSLESAACRLKTHRAHPPAQHQPPSDTGGMQQVSRLRANQGRVRSCLRGA